MCYGHVPVIQPTGYYRSAEWMGCNKWSMRGRVSWSPNKAWCNSLDRVDKVWHLNKCLSRFVTASYGTGHLVPYGGYKLSRYKRDLTPRYTGRPDWPSGRADETAHQVILCRAAFRVKVTFRWTSRCKYSGGATPGKWPGWKINRSGTALPSPAYCFASVIMWAEKIKMLPYLTALSVSFDGETALAACVLRATTKKRSSTFFGGKKCIRVTWLEDFLTLKWPGSSTALAPPLCKYL